MNDWDDLTDWEDEEPDDGYIDGYSLHPDECGYFPGHGCSLFGTEICDFECPIRDDVLSLDSQA